MGTFIGHISPGLAFLSFGILYAFKYSWDALTKREETGASTASSSAPRQAGVRGFLKRLPAEGIMKVAYGSLAALAEFFYPPGTNKLQLYSLQDPDWRFVHPNEWQHFTMYSYFTLSGWVDIVSQACLPRRQVVVENVAIAVAFYIEAFLLYFHQHGKGDVEIMVHELLLLTCLLICFILTAEVWWHAGDLVLRFAKTCLVMVQGTWLLHAAFILYRPFTGKPWKDGDHGNLMALTTFYSWHVAFNMAAVATMYGASRLYWGTLRNTGSIWTKIKLQSKQRCTLELGATRRISRKEEYIQLA
uniref:Transmembrane protein 45B n=2 Tax=Latimeria chalumnae TaxID=7897 RepID=H3AB80_LATCH